MRERCFCTSVGLTDLLRSGTRKGNHMSSVTFNFHDSVVLITGGSSGIGRAIAEAYGRAGAVVVIASRSEEAGSETVRAITENGGRAEHRLTDVSSPEEVKDLVAEIVRRYGGLDIAVNNAGTLPPTGDLVDQTAEDWDRTIAVDLSGVFHS